MIVFAITHDPIIVLHISINAELRTLTVITEVEKM